MEASPTLWKAIDELCNIWLTDTLVLLDQNIVPDYPKTFNDPVWGNIQLLPIEVFILDTPLLQRLRGIRQTGMAHFVYPGVGYDRLEHIRGVVQAAENMMLSLRNNAETRTTYGNKAAIKDISSDDRVAIRLAALLHDIGHGPFSHATEEVIKKNYISEFTEIDKILRGFFGDITNISAGEMLSVLMIFSEKMIIVLTHSLLNTRQSDLPLKIVGHILGSGKDLSVGYAKGIISGPLDADKMDYMARDSHHAGLALGLDIPRLIGKLEVITITPQNAFNEDLKLRALDADNQCLFEMGIYQPGIGAYEQMIVSRVMLYDRLYYHHKVRAAEAMLQKLIHIAEIERGNKFSIQDFLMSASDETALLIYGNLAHFNGLKGGGDRAKAIANDLINRNIYKRAFAFSSRFLGGLEGLSDENKYDTISEKWSEILELSFNEVRRKEIEGLILNKAEELCNAIPDFSGLNKELLPEHIIIDLPDPGSVSTGRTSILMRTSEDEIATPNLYFRPDKWSQAYRKQKHCGYIFCPRKIVPLINIASKIIFAEQFNAVMDMHADRYAKTTKKIKDEWLDHAFQYDLISDKAFNYLKFDKAPLINFSIKDIKLPDELLNSAPNLKACLTKELNNAFPDGLPSLNKKSILNAIEAMFCYLQVWHEGSKPDSLNNEKDLQILVRNHLRSSKLKVYEGADVAEGETDLILLDGNIVIENKLPREAIVKPLEKAKKYEWQARRYAIGVMSNFYITFVAYKPKNEKAIMDVADSWVIQKMSEEGNINRAAMRFVVPIHLSPPSSAKIPKQ